MQHYTTPRYITQHYAHSNIIEFEVGTSSLILAPAEAV